MITDRSHEKNRTLFCSVCGIIATLVSELKSHTLQSHKVKLFNEIPSEAYGLVVKTDAPSQHECAFCKHQYSDQSKLRKHMRKHIKTRAFSCGICQKSYFSAALVKSHMTREHKAKTQTKKQSLNCNSCNKHFENNADLTQHMHLHIMENLHGCDQCDKKFLLESSLRKHVLTHS